MLGITERALDYAKHHHRGQTRKYTGEPYVFHCAIVAEIVKEVTDDEEVIAAAYLHDVVEDTTRTVLDVQREFGNRVAQLVSEVTDVSMPHHGNRAIRKQLDLDHLAKASPEAKTIKLADLIDNLNGITRRDPKFAVVYLREKKHVLNVLREGDNRLWVRASGILDSELWQLEKQHQDKWVGKI